MPVEIFPGEITVVDTEAKAVDALEALSGHKIIGFDTETKPSFSKGRVHKVALMQLSTNDHCYLFRLNRIGMTDGLCRLIENPDIIKVGLSLHDDFSVLHRSVSVEPNGFVDLQSFVKEFHISDISLQKIYAIVFGKRISKGQRLTNWAADVLTPSQQTYAAIDAWACLRLYEYMGNGHFNPEQSSYIVDTQILTDTQIQADKMI